MTTVEELKRRVLDQLFWDDRVDASRIEVAVHDRQVMLQGHAPSYWEAQAAVEDARVVEGDVDVEVRQGEVTLRGSVDSYWKKTRVELIAGEVVGVRNLTNLLAVVPGSRHEDEEVARAVYGALDRNPGVPAGAVGVRVSEGKVILSGVVPDWNSYRAARDAVEFTPGVTDLENNLIIE